MGEGAAPQSAEVAAVSRCGKRYEYMDVILQRRTAAAPDVVAACAERLLAADTAPASIHDAALQHQIKIAQQSETGIAASQQQSLQSLQLIDAG